MVIHLSKNVVTAFLITIFVNPAYATLSAINILGTDGSTSLINSSNQPLVINNIKGLAPSNPATPGDYVIYGGVNGTPDSHIGDSFFQSSGSVAFKDTNSNSDEPANSSSELLLLFEAVNSGTVGQDSLEWSITEYLDYTGVGVVTPNVYNVIQNNNFLSASGLDFSIMGHIISGDKFVAVNSGETSWGVGATVDIDGDGISNRTNIISNESLGGGGSQAFSNSVFSLIGYEIKNGQFILGSFDILFDTVTSAASTWPGGDRFDVIEVEQVPEPTIFALMALGLAGIGFSQRYNKKLA